MSIEQKMIEEKVLNNLQVLRPIIKDSPQQLVSKPRYKLLGSADIDGLPPLEWRIKGVLPGQGMACLYGPSASGKSFLGFDMATAIAQGTPWFDCRVNPAPVVYVCLEGESGFRQRVLAWEQANRIGIPEHLHIVLQPFKLTEHQDVKDLAAVVPPGAVVFVDTLNRAAPTVDENSSRDMGQVIEAAKTLQALTGGLVVLVSHTGKDTSKGLRGHSSLFAALDSTVEVSRNGDSRQWKIDKSKDGADGSTHGFKLKIETLGTDSDGDAITSCVVERDDSQGDEPRVKLPNTGNGKIALDALKHLFKDGAIGKDGAPKGRPSIDLEGAVDAVANRLMVEPKRKRERARLAITNLVSRGVLGQNDGWLWYAA